MRLKYPIRFERLNYFLQCRGPLWLAIKLAFWPAAFTLVDELGATEIIEQHDENGRNALIWSSYTRDCLEATDVGLKIVEKSQGEGLNRRDNVRPPIIIDPHPCR